MKMPVIGQNEKRSLCVIL